MAEDDEAADEFDEDAVDVVVDLDADELDADVLEADLVADEPLVDEADVVEDVVVDEVDDAPERPARVVAAGEDDEDQPDPDDVEADLDTILKDRIAAGDDEEEEEEEEPIGRSGDDGTEGGTRVAPRKAGEFVCSSCFLVKPNTQLADAKKKLCLDCV